MASTHELVRLEELTTTAVVLSRIVLDDPEARVVAHWNPTKLVGKLPEVIRVELRAGDQVVVNSETAIVPFADGESRAAKDVEARQLAGRRTALLSAIQELCEREAERAPKVGAEAISGIVGRFGRSSVLLDEKNRTVLVHPDVADDLKAIFPDGIPPGMAERIAAGLLGVPHDLIGTVIERGRESSKLDVPEQAAKPEPTEAEPEFVTVESNDAHAINGDGTAVACGSSMSAKKTPEPEEPPQSERRPPKQSTGQLSKVLLKYMAGLSEAIGPTDVVKKLGKKYSIDRRQAQNLLGGLKNRLHVKRTGDRRVPSGHTEGLYVITKKGRKAAEEKA